MTKSAFDKIAAGLEDAIAFAGGDTARGRIAQSIDVAAIRGATGKSQAEFAEAYHLPPGTIRDWEQQRRKPDTPARVLLTLIQADPARIEKMLAKIEA
ncbi:MAG: transcriptional regulator [Sphingomonas sp.]|nr:transcriptional regulator [Sphingomonas sp.]